MTSSNAPRRSSLRESSAIFFRAARVMKNFTAQRARIFSNHRASRMNTSRAGEGHFAFVLRERASHTRYFASNENFSAHARKNPLTVLRIFTNHSSQPE